MDWKEVYRKAEAVVDAVLMALGRAISWVVSTTWTAGIVLAVVVVLGVATCSVLR
mgnify:CR=1 FL=1